MPRFARLLAGAPDALAGLLLGAAVLAAPTLALALVAAYVLGTGLSAGAILWSDWLCRRLSRDETSPDRSLPFGECGRSRSGKRTAREPSLGASPGSWPSS